MSENIFRKKSLDKIKSPENLEDYIRVSNPGVWLLLVSIIVLLLGACVWGIFGRINSTVETNVRVGDGKVICNISAEDITSVQVGMTVVFDGCEAEITGIDFNNDSGYICEIDLNQTVPDGIYNGKIVTESISPFSLILN